MKMILKNNVLAQRLLRCTTGFACAILVLGIASYKQAQKNADLMVANQQLLDKLRDTAEQNRLIHLLNVGQIEVVKQTLNQQLAYNLNALSKLTPPAGEATRNFAEIIKTDIARDERKHPEYYLASLPAKSASVEGTRVAQMVRH